MRIAKDAVVTFNYVVSTEGKEVDRSDPANPLIYIHGRAQMVAGLEERIEGSEAGSHHEFSVPPEKGYGVFDQDLEVGVPVDAFPEQFRERIMPGFRFQAEHPSKDGQMVVFTVSSVDDGKARASGNHPMAGKSLSFVVDVVAVREATAEELEHGHIHGGVGCGMRDGSCSGDHCSRDGDDHHAHGHDHH